jgi:hypothetical protein
MTRHPDVNGRSHPGCLPVIFGFALVFSIWLVPACCLVTALVRGPVVNVNTFSAETGATQEEIRAKYGPPSESQSLHDGTTMWYYYTDRLGMGFTMVGVHFDANGRVEAWYNF